MRPQRLFSRSGGCNVSSVDAIEAIEPNGSTPDLVISDYSFGDRYNGLDVIERARDFHGKSLPALIVSGDSSDQVQKKVEDAGLLLIHKPVQPVQLRSALLEIFSRNGEVGQNQMIS